VASTLAATECPFLTAMEKFMYPAASSRVREMVMTSWLKSGLSSGSAFQQSSIIA